MSQLQRKVHLYLQKYCRCAGDIGRVELLCVSGIYNYAVPKKNDFGNMARQLARMQI